MLARKKIKEANYFKIQTIIKKKKTLHLFTFFPFQVNLRYVLLKEKKATTKK